MAFVPITSWQIDGETVAEFNFAGSKITAYGNCSHEIKRCLLLGRKVMTNLDSILKSRDITLSTKVYLVKAMVFPVVMYGCKCWTIKKAECRRIDAFELWCWRLLRVPWTTGRSNQSIQKISAILSYHPILSSVKQITSPGWMHETSAQGWWTGMTQRVGLGKVVGGGYRMGSTSKSMADPCQCMAKTTTIL